MAGRSVLAEQEATNWQREVFSEGLHGQGNTEALTTKSSTRSDKSSEWEVLQADRLSSGALPNAKLQQGRVQTRHFLGCYVLCGLHT
eukprot:3247527-Pleurochrysis_carterae.AAC.1